MSEFEDRTQPMIYTRTGWICPQCGRCINPDVTLCPFCPLEPITWGNTNNISFDPGPPSTDGKL